MQAHWNKMDASVQPEMEAVGAFVDSPLWDELRAWLEERYQPKAAWEYSRCAVPGWNLKYRKAGRALCTLYPMEGSFTALVVIGERERPGAELLLPTLSPYLQQVYRETPYGMGQRWLMPVVAARETLEDVKRLITLRRA